MTIKLRVSRRESKIPVLNHAGPKLLIDMLMISHSHLLKKNKKGPIPKLAKNETEHKPIPSL